MNVAKVRTKERMMPLCAFTLVFDIACKKGIGPTKTSFARGGAVLAKREYCALGKTSPNTKRGGALSSDKKKCSIKIMRFVLATQKTRPRHACAVYLQNTDESCLSNESRQSCATQREEVLKGTCRPRKS